MACLSPVCLELVLGNDNIFQCSFGNMVHVVTISPIANITVSSDCFQNYSFFGLSNRKHEQNFELFGDRQGLPEQIFL